MTLPDISLSDVKELQFSLAVADLEDEARRRSPNRVKVLLFYIVYPLAMGTYFRRALERNPDVDLRVTGPFTGPFIPWLHGVSLPEKYAKVPDYPLPFPPNVGRVNYEFVQTQLGDWKPDIILCVDAGINWASKPQDGYVVTIGTDPHVLDYSHARKVSDKFFNMQKCYSETGDIYLPYAYDPSVHYRIDGEQEIRDLGNGYSMKFSYDMRDGEMDAILIGLPYTHVPRTQWIEEIRKHGVSVIFENGPILDEYREMANRCRMGLNWSTMNDLNARFFETPAFGLPMVANRVPDAHLFLQEDEDYLAFSTLPEAVEKVLYLKNNPEEAQRIAENGHRKILPHTYDSRISEVLRESSF
jgi:hypothetical protein